MSDTQHAVIHQNDYTPPDYLIETVELEFDLDPETTRVVSRLSIRANHDQSAGTRPLRLDGEELKLISLKLDGVELAEGRFQVEEKQLLLHDPPELFVLEVE